MSTFSAIDFASHLSRSIGTELIYGAERPAVTSPLAASLVPRLADLLEAIIPPTFTVIPAPSHVVLDANRGLALKPDLVVVRASDVRAIGGQVWCTPRIAVDVVCIRTARRIRFSRVKRYRLHGVAECWIVDTRHHRVEVHDFTSLVDSVPHIYGELVESKELGMASLSVAQIFGNDTSMNTPSPERRQNVHQRVLADDRARHPIIRVSVRGVGVVKRATREYLETATRRSVDAELGGRRDAPPLPRARAGRRCVRRQIEGRRIDR
jgi:Uma2 family endonuclease